MIPTSHFLGFSIPPPAFADMYVGLQKILGKGGDIVEFQNPLSSHINVGYFSDTLPENPEKILEKYDKKEIEISFTRVGMFGGIENPKVYFLSPDQTDILSTFQKGFFRIYPDLSNFLENKLEYVPHMTIFRVNDQIRFLQKKDQVDRFLDDFLLGISKILFPAKLTVFMVHSNFSPEIQIPLL
ncbi:hypothetical protein KBB25_02435 [Candidatus Gracilibacteria bacterium]|nr:hypothetical protein [Candidatus Gracilibacteria bacterium]